MPSNLPEIAFQMIAFLFAISVHESAHAWTASRCGDQTARMLGRVTLNPIKHIDPVGTILLPLVAAISHIPLLGWAKPTPVDPRNFRHPMRDDIMVSVAGPVSNFIVATGAVVILWIISFTSGTGHDLVQSVASGNGVLSGSFLDPVVLLIYQMMIINVVLAVFNLIPVPPLDGSHVIRHFLSEPIRRMYDSVGIFGLLALVYLGGGLLSALIRPFLIFYRRLLVSF
jgi:Zn-dependent protease